MPLHPGALLPSRVAAWWRQHDEAVDEVRRIASYLQFQLRQADSEDGSLRAAHLEQADRLVDRLLHAVDAINCPFETSVDRPSRPRGEGNG